MSEMEMIMVSPLSSPPPPHHGQPCQKACMQPLRRESARGFSACSMPDERDEDASSIREMLHGRWGQVENSQLEGGGILSISSSSPRDSTGPPSPYTFLPFSVEDDR